MQSILINFILRYLVVLISIVIMILILKSCEQDISKIIKQNNKRIEKTYNIIMKDIKKQGEDTLKNVKTPKQKQFPTQKDVDDLNEIFGN